MAKKSTAPVTTVSTDELKELNAHLKKIAAISGRNVSLTYSLMLSIVRGAGYVIGATLVAGIMVTMIVQAIKTANNIPVIGPLLLQNEALQNSLPSSNK